MDLIVSKFKKESEEIPDDIIPVLLWSDVRMPENRLSLMLIGEAMNIVTEIAGTRVTYLYPA